MPADDNPSPQAKADTDATSLPDDMPPPTLESDELPKPPKLKKSRKGLVIGVLLFTLAISAAGGWYYFLREPAQTAQQAEQPAAEEEVATNDVPAAENSETFTSSPYRLTFQHPATWTVTEANDNSILVESEDFTYQTADGETTNGNFRVYIRKGPNTADSEIIAKGVAIQESEELVYSNPTAVQRTETNLSLFGLDTDDNFAFLLITGNFVLEKGDTLGPDFGNEAETIVVGGGFSAPSLEPGMTTNPVPIDTFKDTNAFKQAIAIIETLEIN